MDFGRLYNLWLSLAYKQLLRKLLEIISRSSNKQWRASFYSGLHLHQDVYEAFQLRDKEWVLLGFGGTNLFSNVRLQFN